MPSIFGKIYPEIKSSGLLSYELKLLIQPDSLSNTIKLLEEILVLKAYLGDIEGCPIKIKTLMVKDDNSEKYNLIVDEVVEASGPRPEDLIKTGELLDVDILATEDPSFKESKPEENSPFFISTFTNSKKEIEIFVKGHEVPWAFSQPIWAMPWGAFHSMTDELGKKASDLYASKFQRAGLDAETIEIIRSLLLNRLANICYTRDKLLFYVQQRRFAKRKGWDGQDFTFEASYYLCHYYLLLWGAVDQLSRILNGALRMGVARFTEVNVLNEKFLKQLKSISPELAKLFETEDFMNWAIQLRRSRHHTAHQGSIILSPILEKSEKELTQEELQTEAEKTEAWTLMKRNLPAQAFEWYQATLKQQIQIGRLRVMVEDAMVINDTKDKQRYVFRPLGNIEWDFKNFELITVQTLETLYEFLKAHPLDALAE